MTPSDQIANQINAELRPRTAGEEVAAQVGVVVVRAVATAAGAARDVVVGTISAVSSFASNPEVQAAAASALSAAAGSARTVAGTAAAAISGTVSGTVQTLRDPMVQAAMQHFVAEGGRRISGAASDVAHGAADLASFGLNQLTTLARPAGLPPLITAPADDDGEFMLYEQDADGNIQLREVTTVSLDLHASAAVTPAECLDAEAPISTATAPDISEHSVAVDAGGTTVAVVPPSPAASEHEQPLSRLLEQEVLVEEGAESQNPDDDVISLGPDSPTGIASGAVGSPITPMYSAAAAVEVASAEPIADAVSAPPPAPATTTTAVQQVDKKSAPKPGAKRGKKKK